MTEPTQVVALTPEEAALIRIRLREIDGILARHDAYLPESRGDA